MSWGILVPQNKQTKNAQGEIIKCFSFKPMSVTRLWSYPLEENSIKFFVFRVCSPAAFGFPSLRLSMVVAGGRGVGTVNAMGVKSMGSNPWWTEDDMTLGGGCTMQYLTTHHRKLYNLIKQWHPNKFDNKG